MELRELKALELAARSKIAFDGAAWIVPSQTSPSLKYRVTLAPLGCQCDDWQLRGPLGPCKHIIAARLVQERDHGGKAPEIVADEVPKRPTYAQDWPAYNEAQMIEKHRLQELLADLCRGLPEPERKPGKVGRKLIPMADRAFASVFKIYSTFSSRRFNSDLQDAHLRGYLSRSLHPNKVNCFLESEELTAALQLLITWSSLPLRTVETVFAPDSSGFSTGRFVRWYDEKYGTHRSGKEWVKAHVMTGVKTNVITAVIIEDKNAADCPQFKPLVEATAANFNVREVTADKAYLSHDNLELLHKMGGTAFVPFKSNSLQGDAGTEWERMYHYFQFRREEFLKHYHQRSNVESTFSAVKRKFGDAVRSRTDTAMKNEVLCKFVCQNICCVIQAQCELGIEATFWENDPAEPRDVLPLVRPG